MKISVSQIPAQGITVTEKIDPGELDFQADVVSLKTPVNVQAQISRITNAVSFHVRLTGEAQVQCSRCLADFIIPIEKTVILAYPVDMSIDTIDVTPDVRQEIVIDLPVKPLCRQDCRGLCSGCGANLNEGGCSCGSTKTKTF